MVELSEIITGKDLKHAICSKREGNPPAQTIDFDEIATTNTSTEDLGENFYGDQDYDTEEIDPDGYDLGSGGNPYDEDRY